MNPGFHYLLSLPSRPLSYLTQYIMFLVVWWAGFPLELPIHSNLDDYFPLKNTLMDDEFGFVVRSVMWGHCIDDAVCKFP